MGCLALWRALWMALWLVHWLALWRARGLLAGAESVHRAGSLKLRLAHYVIDSVAAFEPMIN